MMMNSFARWMVHHPLVVIGANLLVTVVLGFYALHIRIESSLESMLPRATPRSSTTTTREIFGSDDVAVVGVLADDVFAPATLEKIARVTDALAKVKGVEWVVSITNGPTRRPTVPPPRLLPRIPPTPDELEAFKQKLAATPLLGETLVSPTTTGCGDQRLLREPDRRAVPRPAASTSGSATILAAGEGPERLLLHRARRT